MLQNYNKLVNFNSATYRDGKLLFGTLLLMLRNMEKHQCTCSLHLDIYLFIYIHFEIIGDPWNLIGSYW